MKFIKIGSHHEDFLSSPPPNMPELSRLHLEWLEEQKKSGKLLEAYYLVETGRSISIWEFDSADEIDKHFRNDPLWHIFNWELYPAADLIEHIKYFALKTYQKNIPEK